MFSKISLYTLLCGFLSKSRFVAVSIMYMFGSDHLDTVVSLSERERERERGRDFIYAIVQSRNYKGLAIYLPTNKSYIFYLITTGLTCRICLLLHSKSIIQYKLQIAQRHGKIYISGFYLHVALHLNTYVCNTSFIISCITTYMQICQHIHTVIFKFVINYKYLRNMHLFEILRVIYFSIFFNSNSSLRPAGVTLLPVHCMKLMLTGFLLPISTFI